MVHHFDWQPKAKDLDGYVGSDNAGCEETRKSTSPGAFIFGSQPLHDYSVTQAAPSLSSGESEFKAIIKGIIEGLYIKDVSQWLGFV